MRHRVYGKHLGRDKDQRRNLFKSLVQSLLTHGTIQTSEIKAKAIKGLVDKVINSAKSNPQAGKLVQSFLFDKYLRERLVKEIVPKLGSRTSGYTSTVRVGTRLGDQTMMVRMSLIGAEELKPIVKEKPAKKAKEAEEETEEKTTLNKKTVNKKAVPAKKTATKKLKTK